MVHKSNVQQLYKKYHNLRNELGMAYSHGLDYGIISSLHRDLYNLTKLFSKLGIDPDKS